ncbi:MAG: DUF2339 domain-containing protein [Rhodanobacter sp.]|jgi:uncharacterized membrane protein|nr:DUF2339 domain-containing protein [Rhodanobacter sp.]
MPFLIVAACCIAGLIVAGAEANIALGFFGGLAVGLLWVRLRELAARVESLKHEIRSLVQERAKPADTAAHASDRAWHTAPTPAAPDPAEAATPTEPFAFEPLTPAPELDLAAGVLPSVPAPRHPPLTMRPEPATPRPPDFTERTAAWIKRWFTEGNVPVKIGMLVLFVGVAALLKYASDAGWLHTPIEVRLAGIALAGCAALAFGWRERIRRRAFALSLQGGAIGVLVLTAFAAFHFYHLLPAVAAFALLVILVAGAGVLAVVQDALALAVLGILAGFAAPILISTGAGSHITLFSYYALLNLAIFAIAWRKAWRVLNLMGFAFTYGIGTAWGVLNYRTELFASTEPFLLLWFAIYLAIPILNARRHTPQRRDIVDGTLVFGNPLLAFALQAALLEGASMPLAYSALALAVIYIVPAWRLLPRWRILGESFAILAVGFATLAVPLALSARVTASTFALEGAGLTWLGLRQQRALPLFSGIGLQIYAALAFAFVWIFGYPYDPAVLPIINGPYLSALLIAVGALTSAWLYHRAGRWPWLALTLYLWGLTWWLGAGFSQIDRFVPYASQPPFQLAFVGLTAALAGAAFMRLRAPALAWTLALALTSGIAMDFASSWNAYDTSLMAWTLFVIYAAGGYFALRVLRDDRNIATPVAQIGWLWTWTFTCSAVLSLLAYRAALGPVWYNGAALIPLFAAWAIALLRPAWIAPPLRARFAEHRRILLMTQAAVCACVFANLLLADGNAAPLPFVPLFNPVDLAQLALLVLAARWLTDADTRSELRQLRAPLLAGAGFAFITAATLRTAHQLGGAPWDATLWSSNLAQTSLTLVWSVLGVLGWVLGSRRGQRLLWLAGASLMGVVLVKLLLVDRTHLGNLFGIASFIAYGLLCTVIGYFAPAPPRSPLKENAP